MASDSAGRKQDASKTITVDGVDRPTTNSKGQPIAQTEEGTPELRKWFSDSRVIDEEGRLLVVYHGTNNTCSHSPLQKIRICPLTAIFGSGFFTDLSNIAMLVCAIGKGPNVMRIEVRTKGRLRAEKTGGGNGFKDEQNGIPATFHTSVSVAQRIGMSAYFRHQKPDFDGGVTKNSDADARRTCF